MILLTFIAASLMPPTSSMLSEEPIPVDLSSGAFIDMPTTLSGNLTGAQSVTPDLSANAFQHLNITSSSNQPLLRVAIAPVISPRESLNKYHHLAHHLADVLQSKLVFIQRNSYREITALMEHGECDLALVSTGAYIIEHGKGTMEVLATPVVHGQERYRSLLLVRSDSSHQGFEDLKGQPFATSHWESSSSWLFPCFLVRTLGGDPKTYFSKVHVTGGHDRSILALLHKKVEATAVHSHVFEAILKAYPELGPKFKILAESSPWGNHPFVVHPQCSEEQKKKFRQALLSMHLTKIGQESLREADIERFFIPEPSFYDSIKTTLFPSMEAER